ncbi:hypothetical protein ACIKTA_01450 [Hansschlegelia beijingensis]
MCETVPDLYRATYWVLAGMEEVQVGSVSLQATSAEDALSEAIRSVSHGAANYVSVFCEGEEVASSQLARPMFPSDLGFGARRAEPQPFDLYRILGLSEYGLEPARR